MSERSWHLVGALLAGIGAGVVVGWLTSMEFAPWLIAFLVGGGTAYLAFKSLSKNAPKK